ncbi:hypothetical protein ACOSQ2_009980 [Xanthoceras sorbifolium]
MWSIGIYVMALVIIARIHWTHKCRNPTCTGKLPPGSMGLPLLGETIPFFFSSKSLDIHPFLKTRIQIMDLCLRQTWRLVGLSGSVKDGSCIIAGKIHKDLKKLILEQLGPQNLKVKILPELEEMVNQALSNWTSMPFIEVKHASTVMIIDFTVRKLFGYDPEKHGEIMEEEFTDFFEGLMSLPLNIPGTTYHRCLNKRVH